MASSAIQSQSRAEAGSSGLEQIRRELALLRSEPEENEFVRPTEYALQRIEEILEQTASAIAEFPVGYVTTDEKGGIRIEWWHERTDCVHLVVGPTESAEQYLFYKFGDDEGRLLRLISPPRLAGHLIHIQQLRARLSQTNSECPAAIPPQKVTPGSNQPLPCSSQAPSIVGDPTRAVKITCRKCGREYLAWSSANSCPACGTLA